MTKNNFYIVWVEGLSVRKGEKIFSLSPDKPRYTTSMTQAMRIREVDIPAMKQWMVENDIADWVINNSNTFIKTNYLPKGTLFIF